MLNLSEMMQKLVQSLRNLMDDLVFVPYLLFPNHSAWEFYVPPIFASAFRMKCALEKSGAIFESNSEKLARMRTRINYLNSLRTNITKILFP